MRIIYNSIEERKLFNFLFEKDRRKIKKHYDFFTDIFAKYKNPDVPIINTILNQDINDKGMSYRNAVRSNMYDLVHGDSNIYKKFLKKSDFLTHDPYLFDQTLTNVMTHILRIAHSRQKYSGMLIKDYFGD